MPAPVKQVDQLPKATPARPKPPASVRAVEPPAVLSLPERGIRVGLGAVVTRLIASGAIAPFAVLGFLVEDWWIGVPFSVLCGAATILVVTLLVLSMRRLLSDSVTLLVSATTMEDVAFRPDGRRLVCAGELTGIVFNTEQWTEIWESRQDFGRHLTFSPDGGILAAARGSTIRLWNGYTFSEFDDISDNGAHSLAFDPQGGIFAAASDEGVAIWDAHAWKLARKLRPEVHALAFAPDRRILAGAATNGRVIQWNTENWRRSPDLLLAHAFEIRSLLFSPDEGTLVASFGNGMIKFVNLQSRRLRKTMSNWLRNSDAIAFSADGRFFAYGCRAGGIKLCTADGLPVRTLIGHQKAVTSLAFSPDNHLLASTSADGTLRLWPIKA